jgi:hypothetical protein
MDLPALEPEQVAIGQFVVAEARQHDDGPDLGIDDKTAVGDLHAALGTPELQVLPGVPLPVRMPPSSRLHGVPHGTFTLLSKKISS